MRYIATFHTHLSALRTQRRLCGESVQARLAPVPRMLSSSCGTCVLYEAEQPHFACMDADAERVYRMQEDEGFELLREYS